jgi:hypothetical protein
MNMFDAAEKLLRGELTVEEFHKGRDSIGTTRGDLRK